MKIIINACHGGFGLSHEAAILYCKYKNINIWPILTNGRYTYWIVPPEDRLSMNVDFYSLSRSDRIEYNKKYSEQTLCPRELPRDDPILIQVVEELGNIANGDYAKLKIVEIPDDVKWQIEEYDGDEWIAETHRTWK